MRAFNLFVSAVLISAAPTLVSAERLRTGTSQDHHANTAAAENGRAITIKGCLQEGNNGSDYILTHLNEPPVSTATAGHNQPNVVERDDLQEARNAYRLDAGKQLRLKRYVGQEVRVSGTVAEPAHVPTSSSVANGATPPKITESELATIQVKSVTKVRNGCGSGNGPAR